MGCPPSLAVQMQLLAQCYPGLQTLAVPTLFVAGSPVFSKGFPRTPRSSLGGAGEATAAEALLRPLEATLSWLLAPGACAAKPHSKVVRVPKEEALFRAFLLFLFL